LKGNEVAELLAKYKTEIACIVYVALKILDGQGVISDAMFNHLVDALVGATAFTGIAAKKVVASAEKTP
jgi:hypothetical protein